MARDRLNADARFGNGPNPGETRADGSYGIECERLRGILYLHGFRSSSDSVKARLLSGRLTELGLGHYFWCEDLPASPRAAIARIESVITAATAPPVLIGSSLGGYYATYLAERHDLRAVLLNPVVDAARCLAPWTGHHRNLYTGQSFEFTETHLGELADLRLPRLTRPERFWLVVETGDEVLDHRAALTRYVGARQTVIEGGDHGLRHFPELLDQIVRHAFAKV